MQKTRLSTGVRRHVPLLLFILCLLATPAMAQDETNVQLGWSAGARGIFAQFSESSLDSTGFSGVVAYRFAPKIDVELEVGFIQPSSQGDVLAAGDLRLIPVRGTLRIVPWRLGNVLPYVGGGAGYYIASFSVGSATVDRLAELGFAVSQDVDSAFGAHVGGGLEWQTGGWVVGVDVKYLVSKANASATVNDLLTGIAFEDPAEIDLNGIWVAGGFRINF